MGRPSIKSVRTLSCRARPVAQTETASTTLIGQKRGSWPPQAPPPRLQLRSRRSLSRPAKYDSRYFLTSFNSRTLIDKLRLSNKSLTSVSAMPKKGKDWPKGVDHRRPVPADQGESSAMTAMDEIDQALARINALPHFHCTICDRTFANQRTLTRHVLTIHEFTLDGENVPRQVPSPARSTASEAPPMSTAGSVIDPYECLRSNLGISSSSDSDAATIISRPETPAVFVVQNDSDIEEGELREEPDDTLRHSPNVPMELEGEIEPTASRPSMSHDWMADAIAAVAHSDQREGVRALSREEPGPSSARTLPTIDPTQGRIPTRPAAPHTSPRSPQMRQVVRQLAATSPPPVSTAQRQEQIEAARRRNRRPPMSALRRRILNNDRPTVAIPRELAIRYSLTAAERRIEQRVLLGMRSARRDVALGIWRRFPLAATPEELRAFVRWLSDYLRELTDRPTSSDEEN